MAHGSRRLAAIMFTDMVGYSALTSRDEALSLELLEEHRAILRPIFERHHGREIRTIGDAFLVVFASAVESVQCGLEIQQTLAERNRRSPPERSVVLRIGIHSGDIVEEGGDLYGDGVNVAARMEPLARPGGVCISEEVRRHVANRIPAVFSSGGSQKLKNIPEPVEIFHVTPRGEEVPPPRGTQPGGGERRFSGFRRLAIPALLLSIPAVVIFLVWGGFGKHGPPRPPERVEGSYTSKIVVLPFENQGSPEDGYFVDGITEEITARLCGIPGLGVISRSSAVLYRDSGEPLSRIGEELDVGYALEGSVRWHREAGGGCLVRITPQLVRVSDGTQIWARVYEEQCRDLFEVQGDIARQVVAALGFALSDGGSAAAPPTENLDAYDDYLRGVAALERSTSKGDTLEGIAMLERAVEKDSGFALAHARLAFAHLRFHWFHYDHTEARLSLAKDAIDRALEADPALPEIHAALGSYYYWGFLDYDRALDEFQIMLKVRPNDTKVMEPVAYILRRKGRFEEALANLKRVFELSPRWGIVAKEIGTTLVLLRRYEEAEMYFERAIELSPSMADSHLLEAMMYLSWRCDASGAQGALDRARKACPGDDGVLLLAAQISAAGGDLNGALELLETAPPGAELHVWGYFPKTLLEAGVLRRLGNGEASRRSYEEAIALLEEKVAADPGASWFHGALGSACAGLGFKERALAEGRRGMELLPVEVDPVEGPFRLLDMARICVMVDEPDLAMDHLERLMSIPSWVSAAWLRCDPVWEPLRENPRFRKIAEMD